MENYNILERYNLILIRYSGEIWLKSMKVRIRMIKNLINNIKKHLNRHNILFHKYQLSEDTSRIFFFFKNQDILNAINVLKDIFGIYSISPALRTSNELKNIVERTIEVGKDIFKENDTFAINVKRSGKQDYSSQDVAKIVGKAMLDSFSNLKLKVNLSNPIKRIFIEIRGEFSYVFTEIIKSDWGGLPIDKENKVLCMDIGRVNDLLAGFFLMKRGCQIYPILFDLTNDDLTFNFWLNNYKEITKYFPNKRFLVRKVNLVKILDKLSVELKDKDYFCAICRLIRLETSGKLLKTFKILDFEKIRAITDGNSLNNSTLCNDDVDLESIALNFLFSDLPIFTPIIGFDLLEINNITNKISNNLKNFEYCKFKPKNQIIDIEKLKKIYLELKLENSINEILVNIEIFNAT